MTDQEPVKGYAHQSPANRDIVNQFKQLEEKLLREFDLLAENQTVNPRWLAVGRTHIEQGFMATIRAIANPQRVKLND